MRVPGSQRARGHTARDLGRSECGRGSRIPLSVSVSQSLRSCRGDTKQGWGKRVSRRAFSLVELIVVCVVVAVLVSVTIVALRTAVGAGREAKDMGSLRLTMIDFLSWSNDHDGKMLNAGLPDDPQAQWYYGAAAAAGVYPGQTVGWPVVLEHWTRKPQPHWQSSYGPDNLNGEIDPEKWRDDPGYWLYPSRFVYSETMLTNEWPWTYPGRGLQTVEEMAGHYMVLRVSDIASPSSKGVLLHRPPVALARSQFALADGSVRNEPADSLRPPAARPFGNPDERGLPVLHTMFGHKGSDF